MEVMIRSSSERDIRRGREGIVSKTTQYDFEE